MNVMDLMAKISLDNADFDKGLGESESKFSKFGSAISSGAKTAGKLAVGAFATMGTAVAGSTAALIKNAEATASLADTIDKESQKLGISATAYQEWDAILQHTGGDISNLKPAIKTLSKAIEEGDESFLQLGISMEEVQGLSKEDLFAKVITQLQGMEDGTARTALAQKLLGRQSMELGALLNTSAEDTEAMRQAVHDLGGVMSDEAVKNGAAFKDSLQDMKTALSGAKNNLMAEFLPSLTTSMDGLTALFTGDSSGIAKIKEGISGLASSLNKMMPHVIEAVSGIANALISALPDFIETISAQLPTILNQLLPIAIDALVKLADSLASALPKVMEVIQSNIGKITQGLTKVIMTIGKLIVQLFPKIFPMMISVGVQLIVELARGLTQNMSEIITSIIECINVIIDELTKPETLTLLLQCGLDLTLAVAQGLLENAPQLLASALELINNLLGWFIVDGAPMILNTAGKMFESIGEGLLNAWNFVKSKIGELLGKVIGEDGIGGWLGDILGKAQEAFEAIGDGISNAWETITGAVSEFGKKIWNGIKEGVGDLFEKGKEMVEKICEGIKSVYHKITDLLFGEGVADVSGMQNKAAQRAAAAGNAEAQAYLDGLEKGYDIHSPSRRMKWIGEMVMAGFTNGLTEEGEDSKSDIGGIFTDINKELSGDIIVNGSKKAGAGTTKTDSTLENIQQMLQMIMKEGFNFNIPVFIGNQQIDEQTVSSVNRIQMRSGGQVNV